MCEYIDNAASMALTHAQLKILSLVQLNADRTINDIAKSSGQATHSVQYNLARLKSTEVIRPYYLINPHALGLTDYCLFLNPIGYQDDLFQKVERVILKTPEVAYAAQLVGEYLFTGRDVRRVDDFMAQLREVLPEITWDMNFAIRLQWTLFSRHYLATVKSSSKMMRTIDVRQIVISHAEAKLLSALSRNPNLPFNKVCGTIGVAESTGRSIYKRLVDSNVVLGKPCHIELSQIKRIAFRLIISVLARSPQLDQEFRSYGEEHPEISDFVICIGAWDYEYNFEVSDSAAMNVHVANIYGAFGAAIRKVKSMNMTKTIKLHQVECPVTKN